MAGGIGSIAGNQKAENAATEYAALKSRANSRILVLLNMAHIQTITITRIVDEGQTIPTYHTVITNDEGAVQLDTHHGRITQACKDVAQYGQLEEAGR